MTAEESTEEHRRNIEAFILAGLALAEGDGIHEGVGDVLFCYGRPEDIVAVAMKFDEETPFEILAATYGDDFDGNLWEPVWPELEKHGVRRMSYLLGDETPPANPIWESLPYYEEERALTETVDGILDGKAGVLWVKGVSQEWIDAAIDYHGGITGRLRLYPEG